MIYYYTASIGDDSVEMAQGEAPESCSHPSGVPRAEIARSGPSPPGPGEGWFADTKASSPALVRRGSVRTSCWFSGPDGSSPDWWKPWFGSSGPWHISCCWEIQKSKINFVRPSGTLHYTTTIGERRLASSDPSDMMPQTSAVSREAESLK